ncbi:MAG: trigger factor, partial [Gammaproteobacteria bacterium]|nr:trigger factor [Gammaproteobacteria bacterium]
MQITLEKLDGLERRLDITIPSEQVESKVKVKLHKVAAKAKMPGFRPGKVPFDVIQKNYGASARADVLENLIQNTYAEGIRQEKLNPAGRPNIKIISSDPGKPFEYSATFEVYPEVKLNDFKNIEVEKTIAEIADADVEEMLEKMRKNHVTWNEITDSAHKSKSGDQLTIDLTVKPITDDEKAEPITNKDVKFVLGDGHMWVDFEKHLYDLSVGDEKKYTLQMPLTHSDKKLAGKETEFTVKVNKISAPILPELNDEFALKMNIKDGGIAK